MKEVLNLTTTQVRVFNMDVIPFALLLNRRVRQHLIEKYAFNDTDVPWAMPVDNAIRFINGGFAHDDKYFPIESLAIEPRRIIVKIASSSSVCDEFFRVLESDLSGIDHRDTSPAIEPVLVSHETTSIVQMDFPFHRTISTEMMKFASETVPDQLNSGGVELDIIPNSVSFRVSFRDTSGALKKSNVNLVDKVLTIESRVQTNPEDQIYFIASPTDTDSHMELLRQLEGALS